MTNRIAIGSDHAGFALKSVLVDHLQSNDYEYVDVGSHDGERCDYPDFAAAVSNRVTSGDATFGILVCGSGIGVSIAANKVDGIRAALAHNAISARLSREHNDANVLCLGSRMIGETLAVAAVEAFLNGTFEGGRHQGRINKMMALEDDC